MSMKLASWTGQFPMQDEHETGKNGVGVARPGADTDAECREPKPGSDPRVLTVERADRVHQRGAGRALRVGGARAGGAEVRQVGETGTRPGAGLRAESERVEARRRARG